MNDQDYIHKAVELAEGWLIAKNGLITLPQPDEHYIDWPHLYLADYPEALTLAIDALAAQLVRQVDAASQTGMSEILIKRIDREYGDWPIDRTMENLKDCVVWLASAGPGQES